MCRRACEFRRCRSAAPRRRNPGRAPPATTPSREGARSFADRRRAGVAQYRDGSSHTRPPRRAARKRRHEMFRATSRNRGRRCSTAGLVAVPGDAVRVVPAASRTRRDRLARGCILAASFSSLLFVTIPLARHVDARSPPRYQSAKQLGLRQPATARHRLRRSPTSSGIRARASGHRLRRVARRARGAGCVVGRGSSATPSRFMT